MNLRNWMSNSLAMAVAQRMKPPLVAQPTPLDQVAGYLQRMRGSAVFPCTTEQAYFGCVPPAVEQWVARSTDKAEPSRAGNLFMTMHAGFAQRTQHPLSENSVLHICADSGERYTSDEEVDRIFWIRVPLNFPVPRVTRAAFFLPPDHPYFTELQVWYEQARAIEEEILRVQRTVRLFQSRVASSYRGTKETWPELLSFVRFNRQPQQSIKAHDAAALKRAFKKTVSPNQKEQAERVLAACVMLPEKRVRLNAWVNYHITEAP